jgi:hypothetical protein
VVSIQDKERIRDGLLELAGEDADVVSAALTGSHATGAADSWSDIDLYFGVTGPMEAVLDRWTAVLYLPYAP